MHRSRPRQRSVPAAGDSDGPEPVKNIFAQDTAVYLDKYNICIRAGNHCAKILNEAIRVNNTCRIVISFYNTKEEIDLLINVLKNSKNIWNEIL